MAKELSDEEREARRERKRARQRQHYQQNRERLQAISRAYYDAHREQIKEKRRDMRRERSRQLRCVKCGKLLPLDIRARRLRFHEERNRNTTCAACTNQQRKSDAARHAAKLRAELEAYGTPVCPRCGGTNIGRLTRPKPGRRFFCRDCKKERHSTLAALPGTNPYPCPFCQGRCHRAGFTKSTGRQQFHCRACGRFNTLLKAEPKPAGALRHEVTLVIGLAESRRLDALCAARGWRMATAVREIFRKYAAPPCAAVGAPRPARTGESAGKTAAATTLRFTEATLPDARPENMRRQWAQKKAVGLYGRRLHRRVGAVRRLKVRLDDAAWEGLHRVMEAAWMSHQDAARWMIRQEPATSYVPEPPQEPEDRRGFAADLERRLGPAEPLW